MRWLISLLSPTFEAKKTGMKREIGKRVESTMIVALERGGVGEVI